MRMNVLGVSFLPVFVPRVSRQAACQGSTRNLQTCCQCLCEGIPLRSQKASERRALKMVSRILRVDHAGEVGAGRIYAGQMAILGRSTVGPVIQEMWDQEKRHIETFKDLLPRFRARPTALLPLWNVAGFLLGAGTAMLGKEGAMACTIAVEETIGEHYDNQLRQLLQEDPQKFKELCEVIRKFRDEELEHMETGYDHDGELAPMYTTLKQTIQAGCKVAIWLSERI